MTQTLWVGCRYEPSQELSCIFKKMDERAMCWINQGLTPQKAAGHDAITERGSREVQWWASKQSLRNNHLMQTYTHDKAIIAAIQKNLNGNTPRSTCQLLVASDWPQYYADQVCFNLIPFSSSPRSSHHQMLGCHC